MQLNDLRVNLTLDNNGFRLSVAESGRILRQFEQNLGSTAGQARRMEGAFDSLGSRAMRSVQALGMARFALMDLHDVFLAFPKAVMGSAGEIERMTKLMEGLSKQTTDLGKKAEAVSNVKFVFNMAKNAPFEVTALTDTFVKLKTGGMDPLDGSMKALVDSVAKFGGSSEQLHRASIAIQQMGGKGVISMEELRQQLGEAVPTAMQAMAVGMKMSMSQLTKAVSDGTVASGMAMRKMLAVMAVDNATGAAAMMETWTGKLEQLKTTWETWKLGVAGEGFADTMKQGLNDLIKELGSGSAASMGRSIGQGLNSAAMSVIQFGKEVKSMWAEVKIAGELLLYYFAASKIAPMLAAGADAFKGYVATMRAGSASIRADLIAETRARNAAQLDTIRMLEQTVARNSAVIASEQALANERRALRARDLADQIAANRIQLRLDAQRLAAASAAIRAASPTNSSAVRAVQRGTATAAQDVEAQVLMRHADAARIDTAAINARTAALTAQNRAMGAERAALVGSAAGLTAESAQRSAANSRLMESARRLRENGIELTRMNLAMANLRAATAGMIAGLSSMVFSMGGLITVIMAAAWAWNHYSEKAKEAAKNAKIAADADRLFKEGKHNEDTVDAIKSSIKDDEEEIKSLPGKIQRNRSIGVGGGQFNAEQARADEERLKQLTDGLAKKRAALNAAAAQVSKKQGEESAQALFGEFDNALGKKLRASGESNEQAVTKKYDDLLKKGKLTAKQAQDRQNELNKARADALRVSLQDASDEEDRIVQAIGKNRTKVANLPAGITVDAMAESVKESSALEAQLRLVREKRAGVANQIVALEADNDVIVKPPKKPKKAPKEHLDAVERELAATGVSLDKLETLLGSIGNQAVDIIALREGVQSHIDALIASDKEKGVKQHHTAAERAELAALTEKKSLLELLKSTYGDLAKRRQDVTEQYVLANEKMLTGNFDLQPKSKSELDVDILTTTIERMKKAGNVDEGVIQEYQEKLKLAKGILNGENYVAGVEAFGENKKNIDSLAASNITNERARMAAQHAQESAMLKAKYEAQYRLAATSESQVAALREQFRQEDLLLTQKHVNDMKSPLEKLGESWADVTKNMQDATAGWANNAIDMFMNVADNGKLEFGKFVEAVLRDLLRIEMQKTLGGSISTITKGIGEAATKYLGIGAAPAAAGAAGAKSPEQQAMSALATGANTAATSLGEGVKGAATSVAQSMGLQVAQATTAMSADQLAMAALTSMTAAAQAAAMALMEVAATGSGGDAAGFIGAGISAYMGAGSAGANPVMSNAMFANGGIMSQFGSLPLQKYAKGGVATSPQLALFGEGSMNEAYVPLPDGRSIPVTMKGGTSQAPDVSVAPPAVTVNVINQSGTAVNAEQGDMRFDGKSYVLDIVMTAASQPGPFRSTMKEAMK
jgi:tape measure domain-containing protein